MTTDEIIKQVRWCIDEEAYNEAALEGASAFDFGGNNHTDTGMMNRIIIAKIPDALRWVCLYAPSELLTGSDVGGSDTDLIYEDTVSPQSVSQTDSAAGIIDGAPASVSGNRFVLPANFIKLLRVRGSSWHRSVSGNTLIAEDSDDYLKLHDPICAFATADRPQVALIDKARKELECWPAAPSFEFSCVVSPAAIETSPDAQDPATVAVPPLVKTSFIYYLAFLLLTAYGDARASAMLEIAKMNIGRTNA